MKIYTLRDLMVVENEIRVRQLSADICEIFEDYLDETDITIPSYDREGEEGEARLYGTEYYDTEDSVTATLAAFTEEIRPHLISNGIDKLDNKAFENFVKQQFSTTKTADEIFDLFIEVLSNAKKVTEKISANAHEYMYSRITAALVEFAKILRDNPDHEINEEDF
ncbi:MAG: hypothetical protein II399_04410 [Lachnospiraceae bacterium]|nr:hypothetical protein [Lachnospiraceae bacterium]